MSGTSGQTRIILIYAALTLGTLLVFWQARNFGFVNYDDNDYVVENSHVREGLSRDGLVWAFTSGHAANWHPLTWLSLMLDCQVFGPRPGPMHITSVLLHLFNTLLLFAVLRSMTGSLWRSAFVAAAFAIHPMHVESVAWVAERKDVLSTFSLLLTLAAYLSYTRTGSKARYLLTVLVFAAGLMAKPMLVTLPFLLMLLDYWPLNRVGTQSGEGPKASISARLMEKAPLLALAAVSSAVTYLVQQHGGTVIKMEAVSLLYRLCNAFLSYARYIGKLFWPANQAAFYPFDAHITEWWRIALSVLLIAALTVVAIRFRRTQKPLFVGWFWFLGTLVPVIGIIQVGSQSFADRYTYIPYIGLFVAIGWAVPDSILKASRYKLTLATASAVALAGLGVCAYQQAGYWRDSISLFSRAISVTRDNYAAYNNRGIAHCRLDELNEAVDDFRMSLAIKPDYVEAINDLGIAYQALGRFQEATDSFKKAVEIRPDYAEAYYNLGIAYDSRGLRDEAIGVYRKAIQINPGHAEARNNLANTLRSTGRYEEAIAQYRAAISIKPDWAAPMNNLAFLMATTPGIEGRDTDEAVRLARRACELSGYSEPVYLNSLAASYASAGRFAEASETARKAAAQADALGQKERADAIRRQALLYEQGRPIIDPSR